TEAVAVFKVDANAPVARKLSAIASAVSHQRPATRPAARAAVAAATPRRVAVSATTSTVGDGNWQEF
ncbi:hypothetical protein, partial [Xanthomonas perforans]